MHPSIPGQRVGFATPLKTVFKQLTVSSQKMCQGMAKAFREYNHCNIMNTIL